MKTAEEIIAYLEKELSTAVEMHNETKANNKAKAYQSLVKAVLIEHLLEEIKEA